MKLSGSVSRSAVVALKGTAPTIIEQDVKVLAACVQTAIQSNHWMHCLTANNIRVLNGKDADVDENEDILSKYRRGEANVERVERICNAALQSAEASIAVSPAGSDMLVVCIDMLRSLHRDRTAWEAALRTIISSKQCPNDQRALWCVRYVQYVVQLEAENAANPVHVSSTSAQQDDSDDDSDDESPSTTRRPKQASCKPISTVRELYAYLESQIKSNPLKFLAPLLAPYYVAVVEAVVDSTRTTGKDSVKSNNSNVVFARSVIERAVTVCPQEPTLWDQLEALEKSCGNAQALSQIRWRRGKIIQT
jgi:hypothetical protein